MMKSRGSAQSRQVPSVANAAARHVKPDFRLNAPSPQQLRECSLKDTMSVIAALQHDGRYGRRHFATYTDRVE